MTRNTRASGRVLAAGLLAVGAVSSGVALAGRPTAWARPSMAVRLGDLDLRREEGWQAAYERVRAAAAAVCGRTAVRDLAIEQRRRDCYAAAMDDAVAQLARVRAEAGSSGARGAEPSTGRGSRRAER